jgi:rhamnogalacturonyl hydrolase YesR
MNPKNSKAGSELRKEVKVTDGNTPLHLIRPDFGFLYERPDVGEIEKKLNAILAFLDKETPVGLIDSTDGNPVTDFTRITETTRFVAGGFRLVSYEMGILYAGMLRAAEVLKNRRFAEYTLKRLDFIAGVFPWFKRLEEEKKDLCSPLHSVINPASLDDAGTMAVALLKANAVRENASYSMLIDNYVSFICNRQFRFDDGTFARNRPYPDTLWIDDLFMSVSLLSHLGRISGKDEYLDDAVKQVIQFSDRMFDRKTGLFAHSWGKNSPLRPGFHWGRANGWALMAMTELLDVLPETHEKREDIQNLFFAHLSGISGVQSKSGLWHQLLDRNDSFIESSASAIFIYCISKAINRGLISAIDFGPMAVLAWNALSNLINEEGHIEGICVGTGVGFESMFYYHRPTNIYAAHGYGPTVLAGLEIIQLVENHRIENHDGALVFDYVKYE